MEEFKRAYFKMLSNSKIKEIIPQAVYNRKNLNFDLYLDVRINEEVEVSIGGNISSHQANQLYLGLNYQILSGSAIDLHADFQMGNLFSGIAVSGRAYLPTALPTYLQLQTVYSYRKYMQGQSLFYEDLLRGESRAGRRLRPTERQLLSAQRRLLLRFALRQQSARPLCEFTAHRAKLA